MDTKATARKESTEVVEAVSAMATPRSAASGGQPRPKTAARCGLTKAPAMAWDRAERKVEEPHKKPVKSERDEEEERQSDKAACAM